MVESQVPYTMEELIKQFHAVKADATALAEEQAQAMKPYADAMNTIKNFVLLKLDEQKETSVKTHAGTAYISSGIKGKVDNRDALLEHCAEHGWGLLELGVLLEPLKEYINQSGGPPPGVSIESWRRCNIMK